MIDEVPNPPSSSQASQGDLHKDESLNFLLQLFSLYFPSPRREEEGTAFVTRGRSLYGRKELDANTS